MSVCTYRNVCVHRMTGLSHRVKYEWGFPFFLNVVIDRRGKYKCNKE